MMLTYREFAWRWAMTFEQAQLDSFHISFRDEHLHADLVHGMQLQPCTPLKCCEAFDDWKDAVSFFDALESDLRDVVTGGTLQRIGTDIRWTRDDGQSSSLAPQSADNSES